MEGHKTRANGGMLGTLTGKRVMLIGQVTSVDGGNVTLAASDGKVVTIVTADSFDPNESTKFIEVIGTCEGESVIKAQTSTNLGDDFDLATYDEAVRLMQQIPGPYQEPPAGV
eukprot:m.26800 g.26800  ORF g.26800 m.26800 type:complete len:113 (-) comp15553_c0_seq1:64-402(-)